MEDSLRVRLRKALLSLDSISRNSTQFLFVALDVLVEYLVDSFA